MALLYQSDKQTVSRKRLVTRPGLARATLTSGTLCARACAYLLLAQVLHVQRLGLFLLLQWLAYALLPLVAIGVAPLARRRIVALQAQELPHSAVSIFRLLWSRQCHRLAYYGVCYLPCAYLLSLISKGTLPFLSLVMAAIPVLPLCLSSVVGIALQSQGRHMLLSCLSLLYALLVLTLSLLVVYMQNKSILQFDMLLLVPAFAHMGTLTLGLLSLSHVLPIRKVPPVGPLLAQRLKHATHVSPFRFLVDLCTWRELPALLLFPLVYPTQASLIQISYYTLGLLFCTRLVEIVPLYFTMYFLPLLAHCAKRETGRLFSLGSVDALVRSTYSIALLTTLLCTLCTVFCPQIVLFFLGPSYLPLVTIFRILLTGAAISSVAPVGLTAIEQRLHALAVRHPQRKRQERAMHFLHLSTLGIYILLVIPCILCWGMVGVALTSTLVRAVSALGTLVLCRRFVVRSSPVATASPHSTLIS